MRERRAAARDRKSTRLNSSHSQISYAVFCLKKKYKPQWLRWTSWRGYQDLFLDFLRHAPDEVPPPGRSCIDSPGTTHGGYMPRSFSSLKYDDLWMSDHWRPELTVSELIRLVRKLSVLAR